MRKGAGLAIAALAVMIAYVIWSRPVPEATTTIAAPVTATTGTQTTSPRGPAQPVPKVELEKLKAPRPAPQETRRNPFRFEGTRQPGPPGRGLPGPSPAPGPGLVTPSLPPPSPMPIGPPPIPLKFIGILEATRRGTKLAVLSDGRDVFYGKEGDVIDGRYRIVRIGVESIELEYLDGRGRQTIRLTG